jgi:erythromycin esterase
MRVMFAVWNTEEMLALVEWMRAWNAAHRANPVRFLGYDMQDNQLPVDTLRAFLSRHEPSLVEMVDEYLGEYRAMPTWSTPQIMDTTRTRWREGAEDVLREVNDHRGAWLDRAHTRADTMEVEWAVQSANLVLQAARSNETLNVPDRDSLMAANLDWALTTLMPGAKAVAWAHDVHVAHGGDRALSFFGGSTMGAELKRRMGGDYQALSLLFYEGAYTGTRSFSDHVMIAAEALPGPVGSVERALHTLVRPSGAVGWIVDLTSERSERSDWFDSPRRLRHVGYAAYDYAFDMEAVFPLEFDGIIFIDRTTPSKPLKRDGPTDRRTDGQ